MHTLLCLYCGEILTSKKLSVPEVTSNFFMKSSGIFSLGFNLFLSIWFKHNDLFVSINSLVLRLYPFRSNFTTLTPYYAHRNQKYQTIIFHARNERSCKYIIQMGNSHDVFFVVQSAHERHFQILL